MPRPGYIQLRETPENLGHIAAICKRLGLDPADWGSKPKAINFALRVVALGLVRRGGQTNED